MRFFLDNNLSTRLADGMCAFGEDVTHLQNHFVADTADAIWLQDIGQKGWILITRDQRITKNPAEKMALRQNNVGAFFLAGKNRSHWDLVEQLVRNWRRLKSLSSSTDRPFAFRIPSKGTKFERIQ